MTYPEQLEVSHPMLSRILANSEVLTNGCREWRGTTVHGYASVSYAHHTCRAHRAICAFAHGPATESRPHALHRCNNKACVESEHLYWGTDADNARDRAAVGMNRGGRRILKTHCVRGHAYDEANTRLRGRGRERTCRKCAAENNQRYYQERKVAC